MVIVVGNPALGNPQSSLYCAEPKVINYDPTTLLGDCSCSCPSFAPDPSTCSAPLVWRPELCQCACEQGNVGGPCIDNTPTSCLIRSDSLCGYNINPRDVVHAFRVFDAYNNVENQRAVSEAVLAANKHYQAAITFSSHQDETLFNDAWVAYMAESLAKLEAHSICIKDVAAPYLMGKWVRSIKTAVPELPVHIQSHYTTGFSPITYIQAIEAGASCIDCGIPIPDSLVLNDCTCNTKNVVCIGNQEADLTTGKCKCPERSSTGAFFPICQPPLEKDPVTCDCVTTTTTLPPVGDIEVVCSDVGNCGCPYGTKGTCTVTCDGTTDACKDGSIW